MARPKSHPTLELVQETRQRILAEAEHLFAEKGYKGVSMQAIAEAVGHTPAALYYHFPAKEDIFLAVLQDGLNRQMIEARTVIAHNPTFADQLAALSFVLMNKNGGAHMSTLMRDAHEYMSRARFEACMGSTFETYREIVADVFAAAQERGECTRAINAAELSLLLFGMSLGIGGDPLNRDPTPTDDEHRRRARLVADTLLHGIATS